MGNNTIPNTGKNKQLSTNLYFFSVAKEVLIIN